MKLPFTEDSLLELLGDYRSLSEIFEKINVEERWDKKWVENKLKLLKRNNLIIIKEVEGKKYYKKLSDRILIFDENLHLKIGTLEKAIKENPSDIDNYCKLAKYYLSIREFDDALRIYQDAYLIDPKNFVVLRGLIESHHSKGNLMEAQKIADGLNLEGSFSDGVIGSLYTDLGYYYYGLKEHEKGIKMFEKSLYFLYDNEIAHFELGLVEFDQNNWEQAASCFRHAIEFEYEGSEVWSHYFTSMKHYDSLREALDVAEERFSNCPHEFEEWEVLIQTYVDNEELDRGLKLSTRFNKNNLYSAEEVEDIAQLFDKLNIKESVKLNARDQIKEELLSVTALVNFPPDIENGYLTFPTSVENIIRNLRRIYHYSKDQARENLLEFKKKYNSCFEFKPSQTYIYYTLENKEHPHPVSKSRNPCPEPVEDSTAYFEFKNKWNEHSLESLDAESPIDVVELITSVKSNITKVNELLYLWILLKVCEISIKNRYYPFEKVEDGKRQVNGDIIRILSNLKIDKEVLPALFRYDSIFIANYRGVERFLLNFPLSYSLFYSHSFNSNRCVRINNFYIRKDVSTLILQEFKDMPFSSLLENSFNEIRDKNPATPDQRYILLNKIKENVIIAEEKRFVPKARLNISEHVKEIEYLVKERIIEVDSYDMNIIDRAKFDQLHEGFQIAEKNRIQSLIASWLAAPIEELVVKEKLPSQEPLISREESSFGDEEDQEETIFKPFKAYQGKSPYVFVSYSHKDKGIVYPDIKYLHENGINIWYDEGIPFGQNWQKTIPERIQKSALFLVFISKNSVVSKYVNKEVQYVGRNDKNPLPVYIEDVSLPFDWDLIFGQIQAIMTHELKDYRRSLLDGVRNLLKTKFT